jgi:RNA polymerase-binding transcription factor DksA
MLKDEEQECLKQKLKEMLARILHDVHVAVDAEILFLCLQLDRERELRSHGADLRGWKKSVKVEVDFQTVEVLNALRRFSENTYGRCLQCNAELLFEELKANPSEEFCASCRLTRMQFDHN